MISALRRAETWRHAIADAFSKRRFSSVIRTLISAALGVAEPKLAQAGAASATAPAANPALDIFRKSRLELLVDIFASSKDQESHACQIILVTSTLSMPTDRF